MSTPEALQLVDEYAQEVKDFGYVENSYVRAKLENHLACLHAECEALRADAGRWRWLRDEAPGDWQMEVDGLPLFHCDFDAAIDREISAAMAKEQTK